MPFAHALLLYICAGVGEALLQSPPAAPPHAVLPGYHIVLAFPATAADSGSGDLQASPFRSAFFPVVAHQSPPFHPATAALPAQRLFPAPTPLVDVDNYLSKDDRPTSYSSAASFRATIPQQSFRSRQFGQQDDSGVVQYPETQKTNRIPPQYDFQRYLEVVGRFDSSRNLPETRVAQTAANNEGDRFPSQNADDLFSERHFKPSQRQPDGFRTNRPHPTRENESDRHFQSSQQREYDFSTPLQQEVVVTQHMKPSYTLNDKHSSRSHADRRYNTFSQEISDPSRNQQITPILRKQIQQYGYTDHHNNEYNSNSDENLGSIYRQSHVPSSHIPNDVAVYSSPSNDAVTSPAAQYLEDHRQSYQVDVKSNDYGYRYAVQSHHNYN